MKKLRDILYITADEISQTFFIILTSFGLMFRIRIAPEGLSKPKYKPKPGLELFYLI